MLAQVVARAWDSVNFLGWHNLSLDDNDWRCNQSNSILPVVEVLGLQAVLPLAVDGLDRTDLRSVLLHIAHTSK